MLWSILPLLVPHLQSDAEPWRKIQLVQRSFNWGILFGFFDGGSVSRDEFYPWANVAKINCTMKRMSSRFVFLVASLFTYTSKLFANVALAIKNS